jgi:hypothetical protein
LLQQAAAGLPRLRPDHVDRCFPPRAALFVQRDIHHFFRWLKEAKFCPLAEYIEQGASNY